jgi:hypothetical protein
MDAAIGILGDGRSLFAFNGATPAADLWEIHSRIVSKIGPDFGLVASIYGGNAQANGSDARMINRSGIDLTMIYRKMKLQSFAKFNDWGPFDYHRDFNETFSSKTISLFRNVNLNAMITPCFHYRGNIKL